MSHLSTTPQKEGNVHIVPTFEDNYVFIFECPKSHKCAIVDPGSPDPVLSYVKEMKLEVESILLTHHHWDHIDGVDKIRETLDIDVIGHKLDKSRLPSLNLEVIEGEQVKVGDSTFNVIGLNGHTIGHIGYHCAEQSVLFSGDTIFMMGCGRMFEGSKEQMWESLLKIRALPSQTLIHCTHEYTKANATFCAQTLGQPFDSYLEDIEVELSNRKRTVPATLELETKRNPFLAADSTTLADLLDMKGEVPAQVFGRLRELKDHF